VACPGAADQIFTIDTDQGQSGASAADREGFQRLVAEVGMGRAGIVLGLEVSRLARNNADWHRLARLPRPAACAWPRPGLGLAPEAESFRDPLHKVILGHREVYCDGT
jgi:hypothetical protein